MIAIVLCAGFATRMAPVTRDQPTALLDVAGQAVLDYTMPQLLDLPGLDAIHVVTNGHYAAAFFEWWERWQRPAAARGRSVVLHNDGSLDDRQRLGEVGDLAFVLRLAGAADDALVMSGDTIYRFSLRPLLEQFRGTDRHYVLAFPETHPQVLHQASVVAFAEDGRVERLHHRPEEPPTKWVCPPLYLLHRTALDRVSPYLAEGGDPESLDRFVDALAQQEPVYALPLQGRDLRLRVNTRYMLDRANELLTHEPLMVDA